MNDIFRSDINTIVNEALQEVLPDSAVKKALEGKNFSGDIYLVAIGKAAWQMANAAVQFLPKPIKNGIVITKYKHVKGNIPGVTCFEAGHPVPDENSFKATRAVLSMCAALNETDEVLFLVSGGGSALFEAPCVSGEELADITNQLLKCGASITEINTLRKRLSLVKGGKFANICSPAHITSIILSDIVGDPLDMIASGPAVADTSTCSEALAICQKYNLVLSVVAKAALAKETPKAVTNVDNLITGSVTELVCATEKSCRKLGYETIILGADFTCEAKELANILVDELAKLQGANKLAIIAGGETVVKVKGTGLGGRNQELALTAAKLIDGKAGIAVFSLGSDGTDGPTDAAGGMAFGSTWQAIQRTGANPEAMLENNDAYHALKSVNALLLTGPTGTNVNDVSVLLYNPNM